MASNSLGGLNFEDFVLRRQQHINSIKELDLRKKQKEVELDAMIAQIEQHKGALQELDMLMQKITQQAQAGNPETDPNAESDM